MIKISNRFNKYILVVLCTGGLGLAASHLVAQQKAPSKQVPATNSAPKPDTAPPASQTPDLKFVGVDQAQKAGVKTCLPLLKDLTGLTVDGDSAAISTWNKDAPDKRAFSALNFMKYNNKTAPHALGLVSAVPNSEGRCDGSNIRIQSSALSCEAIAANLAKQNAPAPQMVGDVRTYLPNQQGQRTILTPAATSGCIVVFTGTYYGQ